MTVAYPAHWEADALLSNGRPIHVRPITPDDGDLLRQFHDALSQQTVHFRFFGAKPHLSDADVAYFTGIDYVGRVALVAVDSDGIAGVGRFDAVADGTAEVAFVIRDSMQGLGLGSVLLEHLAAAARERGVSKFVAEVLPENHRMLTTFSAAGYEVSQKFDSDVIAVSFDVEPTTTSVSVMRAREHRAEARSVERLLHPGRVAVIGAGRRPGGLGHAALLNLVNGGFTGDLVAVHHEVDSIAGVPCVRSLADIDGRVDVAVVAVSPDAVASVVREAAAAHVVALVVLSGGFGDSGVAGPATQHALVDSVHRTGMRLVGPNALGVINTSPAVRLNASLVPTMPEAGTVGFFCQSGALGASILDRLTRAGVGLSTFVSAGNRADISGNDLLQYWEDDADTSVVMLYLETIGNARKFARVVHRLSARKPVVMVRSGGAAARHPLGHDVGTTGLSQAAVDRILADCGVILVDTIDEMIDVARVAAWQPLPTSASIAVLGNSDALAVMAANACVRNGLTVAGEPRSFSRGEPATSYGSAVRAALDDPAVGAAVVIHVPPIEHASDAEVAEVLGSALDDSGGKPVVVVSTRRPVDADAGPLAWFDDVEDAVRALSALVGHARWRAAPEQASEPEPIEPAASPLAPGRYADDVAAELLRSAGVHVAVAATTGRPGVRIRLFDDPLFGPVLMVGLDDPVADALDDRSFRLAPVSRIAAETMLAELRSIGAVPTAERDGVARAIAEVSALAVRHPEIAEVDVSLLAADSASGAAWVGSISLSVNPTPTALEPPARRM